MNAHHPKPSTELVAFVAEVGDRLAPSHDRRHHHRYQFSVPAHVQPLDDRFGPIGKPLASVTRDLSAAGIGLLYTSPIDAPYLEVTIELPAGTKRLIVKVLRCRPIGAFFDIGGCFVARPEQADG